MELGTSHNKIFKHHYNSQIVVTTVVTTAQQSISAKHPNFTTPRPKNPILPQVTLQSTVKPTIEPRYPHMSYQPFRPMMKPIQKQRTFTRNNIAKHNYNYVNRSQIFSPKYTKSFIFTKTKFLTTNNNFSKFS